MIFQWTNILQKALDTGRKDLFVNIPQVDLHCHSITSASFQEFQKLAYDLPLPPKNFNSLKAFNLYLKKNINPLIKNISIIRLLVRSAFQRLVSEGVIYTEMSFDLTLPYFIGISMEEYLGMINEERKGVSQKLKVCIEAGLDRDIDPQKLFLLLKQALKKKIIGSIDLYGNEKATPIKNFIEIYKLADKHNLKLKAHVGEIGNASDVKEAVERLNLQAVQHGIKAADNLSILEFLVKKEIVFNICPSSNLSLGLIKDIKTHPIRKLFDNGAIITIGSDDFSIFNKSIGTELINLYRMGTFSKKEIEKLIINGINQINTAF